MAHISFVRTSLLRSSDANKGYNVEETLENNEEDKPKSALQLEMETLSKREKESGGDSLFDQLERNRIAKEEESKFAAPLMEEDDRKYLGAQHAKEIVERNKKLAQDESDLAEFEDGVVKQQQRVVEGDDLPEVFDENIKVDDEPSIRFVVQKKRKLKTKDSSKKSRKPKLVNY